MKTGERRSWLPGPRAVYQETLPCLETLGTGASYVGVGELARIVTICHDAFLGVVTQSLAEMTVPAERAPFPAS